MHPRAGDRDGCQPYCHPHYAQGRPIDCALRPSDDAAQLLDSKRFCRTFVRALSRRHRENKKNVELRQRQSFADHCGRTDTFCGTHS